MGPVLCVAYALLPFMQQSCPCSSSKGTRGRIISPGCKPKLWGSCQETRVHSCSETEQGFEPLCVTHQNNSGVPLACAPVPPWLPRLLFEAAPGWASASLPDISQCAERLGSACLSPTPAHMGSAYICPAWEQM